MLSLWNLTGLSSLLFQCHAKNSNSHSKIKELFFTIIFSCQLFALSPCRPEPSLSLAFFFLPLSCESSWPLLEVTRRISPVSNGMWVSPSWEFTYKEAGAPHLSGLFVLLTHGHDKPFSFHGCSRVKPLCFLSCLSSVFSSALVFRFPWFSGHCHSPCPTEMPIL